MKKSILIICSILVGFNLCAQNKSIPAGKYQAQKSGLNLQLTIEDDDSYEISMMSGKLEETEDKVKLNTSSLSFPTFRVKFNKTNEAKDSIHINFNYAKSSYYLKQVYMAALQTKKETADYKNPKDFSPASNDEVYVYNKPLNIRIAKAKYLHLIESPELSTGNDLSIYEIPTGINEIEIIYNPSRDQNIELSGVYDKDEKTVTVSENGKNPIVFRKDYKDYLKEFVSPIETKKDIEFEGEFKTDPAVKETYNTDYRFKLERFETLKSALVKTKEENKVLVGLYLPNKTNAKKNFKDFTENYEKKISNLMYNKYIPAYDGFYFYLIETEEEKNQFKKDLKPNTMIAINGQGQFLYQREANFKNPYALYSILTYKDNAISNVALVRELDNSINSKNFDQEKVQQLFLDLVNFPQYSFNSGHESIKKNQYDVKVQQENNITSYQLKSDPEDIDQLFEKLVKSHKNDDTVDFEYVHILVELLKLDYRNKIYKDYTYILNEPTLQGIDYLLNFKKSIKEYKATTDDDYARNYYFHDLYRYTISDALLRAAPNSDKAILKKIKPRMKQLNVDDNQKYINFLQRYIPEDFLKEYDSFYKEHLDKKENIILILDEYYTSLESNKSWEYFKRDIANQANNASWYVVENKADKKTIKKAIKWSETSLKITPKNPYYLDTKAQLLYKKGDHKEAIKIQEEAVKELNENPETYSGTSTTTKIRITLKEMKEGTFNSKP